MEHDFNHVLIQQKNTHTNTGVHLSSFWYHLLSWFMVQTIEASLRAAAAHPAELSRHSSLTSLIKKGILSWLNSEMLCVELPWGTEHHPTFRDERLIHYSRWTAHLEPLAIALELEHILKRLFFSLFFVVALYLLIKSNLFKWPQWEPWSSP